ncbi:MAG: hypothetical protein V3S62_00675 [Acidimicrobiia bacterium]
MPLLRLITAHDDDPARDTALSTALLQRVGSGEIDATLRLWTPGRIVAFGSQDRTRPGYPAAVDAATRLGFGAVERLAGGKAAVFHEGTIAFAWTTPNPDPKTGIAERFRAISAIVIDALSRLGVTGVVGEVSGEYCPGRFSVNVGGLKVMGVGQRLLKYAAHVGGVLVAHSPDLVNLPLIPVYEALGYEWRPEATGSIERPVDDVIGALTGAFATAGHSLRPSPFEQATAALATDLADRHLPRIP